MANEYQLSYTAQEIDEKLDKIDSLECTDATDDGTGIVTLGRTVQNSGGGNGSYIVKVNMTYDEEGNPTFTTEGFNWEELQAAVEAGKAVFCRVYDADAKKLDGFTWTNDYPLFDFSQEEQWASFVREYYGYSELLEVWYDGSVGYERVDLSGKSFVVDLYYSESIVTQGGSIVRGYSCEVDTAAVIQAMQEGRSVIGRLYDSNYVLEYVFPMEYAKKGAQREQTKIGDSIGFEYLCYWHVVNGDNRNYIDEHGLPVWLEV